MNYLEKMAQYYGDYYGDRTDELLHALQKPADKIALVNPWLSESARADVIGHGSALDILGSRFYRLAKDNQPRMINGLLSHYFLDSSSVLAPLLLPLKPGMEVLDMCSAPGGKLLVMLSRGVSDLHMVANDVSKDRAIRLKKVVHDFVPEYIRKNVKLTIKDAHFFGLTMAGSFDAVLLDAPCSSEGHVVLKEPLLKAFKGPQKSLPMRQYSLLAAALLALRSGGHVVYATCSINPKENQGVIERLLHKKKEQCALMPITVPTGQEDPYGWTILPHLHQAGPAFVSLLKRL